MKIATDGSVMSQVRLCKTFFVSENSNNQWCSTNNFVIDLRLTWGYDESDAPAWRFPKLKVEKNRKDSRNKEVKRTATETAKTPKGKQKNRAAAAHQDLNFLIQMFVHQKLNFY